MQATPFDSHSAAVARRRCRNLLCLLATCTTISACTKSNERPVGFAEWDSAGTSIAESTSPAWTNSYTWLPDTIPTVRIGGGSSPDVYFDRILQVLRLNDGRLLVTELQGQAIRLFDSRGKLIRTIGRAGAGPGEFRAVSGAALLGGDTLLAFDPRLLRLSFFDTAGSLLTTVQLQPQAGPQYPRGIYRIAGVANRTLVLVPLGYSSEPRPNEDTYWNTMPNLLFTLSGSFVRSIGEPSGMDAYDTGKRSGGRLFGRYTSAVVRDSALVMTDGGQFSIRSYTFNGHLIGLTRIRIPQRAVTEHDLAQIPEEFRQRQFPAKLKPWISRMVVSDQGDLWVEEYREFNDRRTPARWYVLDPSGHWLTTVTGRASFRLTNVTANSLIGIWTGPFGVEEVHEYRMRRPQ